MITTFLFFFIFSCFGSIIIYSLFLGISPMPSSQKAQDAIIQLLPNDLEGGVIYELGSGWGGLALDLAKRHPEAKVIAFELSPVPLLFSRVRQLLSRRTNLTILRKNFYDYNLSDAKAIICYLFPGGMRKLAPKLRRELPKNCVIISNTFSLPDWESDPPYFLNDLSSTRIYRYFATRRVP